MRKVSPKDWHIGVRFDSQYGWRRLCHANIAINLYPLNWRLRIIRGQDQFRWARMFQCGPCIVELQEWSLFTVDANGDPVGVVDA